jgi:hypothetical protein
MMGHSVKSERKRELYGDGMPLEVRAMLQTMIGFGVPEAEKRAAKRAFDKELKRRRGS